MNRIDPYDLAAGRVEVPGLTVEQARALTLIGRRIIGLEQDLQQLEHAAHKQVVQDLVQDFIDIAAAILPDVPVTPERLHTPVEQTDAGRLAKQLAGRAKRPLRLSRQVVRPAKGYVPKGNKYCVPIPENEEEIVRIACTALNVIADKAKSGQGTVTTGWLRCLAADFRDVAELCGVDMRGPEVPGRNDKNEETPWQN